MVTECGTIELSRAKLEFGDRFSPLVLFFLSIHWYSTAEGCKEPAHHTDDRRILGLFIRSGCWRASESMLNCWFQGYGKWEKRGQS